MDEMQTIYVVLLGASFFCAAVAIHFVISIFCFFLHEALGQFALDYLMGKMTEDF